MVDDGVHHHVVGTAEFGHIIPRPQTGVHLGVVYGVETGISPVIGGEKGENMHTFVDPLKAGAQEMGERGQRTVPEPVRVCNQLDLVIHEASLGHLPC